MLACFCRWMAFALPLAPQSEHGPRRKDGEWSKSRMFWTQVQNAQPNNLDQFRDGTAQPIVWRPEARTGTLIYPYEKARQK